MPLPTLTPRRAAAAVIGAVWLGATLGLVDHVLAEGAPSLGLPLSLPVPAGESPNRHAPPLNADAIVGSAAAGAPRLVLVSPSATPSPSASASPSAQPSRRPSPSPAAPAPAASPSGVSSPSPAPTSASPSGSPAPSPAAADTAPVSPAPAPGAQS